MSTDLIKYDEMCRAINAAYEVDEVKDIRDKARALEAYFQQAKNPEPERRACEIRLRAERRAGQLLAERDKAKGTDVGGRTKLDGSRELPSNRPETYAELGISRDQASKWQQLAAIPHDEFEAALAAPSKPSTSGILASRQAAPRPMNPHALWLWGRLRDFERSDILKEHPAQILLDMTDGMQADMRRLLPMVIEWLRRVDHGEEL